MNKYRINITNANTSFFFLIKSAEKFKYFNIKNIKVLVIVDFDNFSEF